MQRERNWTVLFIGGASGTGKSSIAYELARYYSVNVMEVDDINAALKVVTSEERFPSIHYFRTSGANWREIGVDGNVNWLINVSKEMVPAIKAIVVNHLDGNIPVIIEGDFIYPEMTKSFNNPRVKSIFLYEPDKNQIIQNYFNREGGELQGHRAECSDGYGKWLVKTCKELDISIVEARPWNTAVERIIKCLL